MSALLRYAFSVVLGIALALAGCTGAQTQPPKTPQEQARRDIDVLGLSVQFATDACAEAGKAMRAAGNPEGVRVLTVCADAYDYARKSLEAAEQIVDAWDDQAQGRLACTVAHALDALDRINAMIMGHAFKVDAKTSARIEDGVRTGIALTKYVGGDCLEAAPTPKDAGADVPGLQIAPADAAAETSALDAQDGGSDG